MRGTGSLRSLWTSGLLRWRRRGSRGPDNRQLNDYLLDAPDRGCKVFGGSLFVL